MHRFCAVMWAPDCFKKHENQSLNTHNTHTCTCTHTYIGMCKCEDFMQRCVLLCIIYVCIYVRMYPFNCCSDSIITMVTSCIYVCVCVHIMPLSNVLQYFMRLHGCIHARVFTYIHACSSPGSLSILLGALFCLTQPFFQFFDHLAVMWCFRCEGSLRTCMYVCMYVCMYAVIIWRNIFAFTHHKVIKLAGQHVYICINSHVYMCIISHVYMCIRLHVYICINSHVYMCISLHVYICIHLPWGRQARLKAPACNCVRIPCLHAGHVLGHETSLWVPVYICMYM
jgi:hypothetical protein